MLFMKKSKIISKFAITLAAVIIIAVAIAPLQVHVSAQSAANTNGGGSNTVKTLRIGYYHNITNRKYCYCVSSNFRANTCS